MHYLLHPFIYRLFYYFKFKNLTIKIRPFKCTHFYFNENLFNYFCNFIFLTSFYYFCNFIN